MRRVHFFVCVNTRSADSSLPCCHARGSETLLEAFRAEFARRGYPRGVKVSASSCLTTCQHGPTVCVYPEAVWYGPVTPADVATLFDAHLSGTGPVTRLQVPADVPVW